jgi:hypothetical protein
LARRVVHALDGSVLAMQGRSGPARPVTGAAMIVDLVAKGRRVGVTAMSQG